MSKSPDVLKSFLILSLITYGGLPNPVFIKDFIKHINSEYLSLKNAKGFSWIYLSVKPFGLPANERYGFEEFTSKLVILDDMSLMLLKTFLEGKTEIGPLSEYEDVIWSTLKKACSILNVPFVKFRGPNKFKKLCEIAYAGIETQEGLNLSNVSIEVSQGRVPSSSLRESDFLRLLGLKKYNRNTRIKSPIQIEAVSQRSLREFDNLEHAAFEDLKSLRGILQKTNKNEVLHTLEQLIYNSEVVELLKLWCVYLLKERRLVLSSVKTYLSRIGKFLVYRWPWVPTENITCDEWSNLFELILEGKKGILSRKETATCLMDFYSYHASCNRFYPWSGAISLETTGVEKFVRAGYLDDALIDQVLRHIKRSPDLSQETKVRLKLLIILANRTGMRIGELLKLTTADFEQGTCNQIYVCNNNFGKNKTDNAKRHLPIKSLLKEVEFKFVRNHLYGLGHSRTQLIFHPDGKPSQKWNQIATSHLISQCLKQISGDETLTFHHFRHTALSRMQLIISQDWELVKNFTDYSRYEMGQIYRECFRGSDNGASAYFHLSKFAGHASPDVTFYHYLHFNELIWHRSILNRNERLDVNVLSLNASMTRNSATRLLKEKYFRKRFIDYLITKLKNDKLIETPRAKRTTLTPLEFEIEEFQLSRENIKNAIYEYVILGRELADHWPDDQRAQLEKSLLQCAALAGMRTKRNNARFPSKIRKNSNDQRFCLPFYDHRNCDPDEVADIIAQWLKLLAKKPEVLKSMVEDIIMGSDQSRTGVRFTSPKKLKLHLKYLILFFPPERVKLIYQVPSKAMEKVRSKIAHEWTKDFYGQTVAEQIKVKNPRTKYMSARLLVLEHDIKDQKQSLQASRVLQNAALEFVIVKPELLSFDDCFCKCANWTAKKMGSELPLTITDTPVLGNGSMK